MHTHSDLSGRLCLTAQIAQFVLFFGIGAVFMSQQMVAPGQIAAVFATFGILYALQVPSTARRTILTHLCRQNPPVHSF